MSVINKNTFEALKESTGGDFIIDLIDTFLEDMPIQLELVKQSLAAQDVEAFRRAAHTIKSNAATFGADALAMQARELETLARGNDLDAGSRLQSLEEALNLVIHELKGLR